ncbi:MAG TPA: ester cyclase [Nitrolancea sp.]|jgi:steroid delta-isomerase-like uncharacterized protein|nr:ester cyclase [Nitrolancea sp.]
MSSEANKDVVRGWVNEVLNGHDIAAIETYYASNCVHHDVEMGDGYGLVAEKQVTTTFISGFPDLRCTIKTIFAEGDQVAALSTFSGTHSGDLMGLPPTGKQFEASIMLIFQLADGKIVEHWSNGNIMSQLNKLGIIPQPATA